ncbi:MAG TPA: hypothetical protein VFL47_04190, partial [Flavisolibacter sp.]|nr:hypothetical protein [Flavisolibacter sp.]
IVIDGETRTITKMGTAATAMTTLFVPVSTGPWLTFPVGTTNLPITNATGFTVGQKIGIDLGGHYEVATVTAVGKAATQTNLVVAAKAGDNTIRVAENVNMTAGDVLTINTGARKEVVKVKRIINVVTTPARGASTQAGEVELTAPLKLDHMNGVDVAGAGTGISFSPATRFVHKSGEAVQALGSGITLDKKLDKSHAVGAAIINAQNTTVGYQGSQKPNQWYGLPLSTTAGSIALTDASGAVLVDGMVYGSQQSNSSANGTIASPEIATLEGVQTGGGCIVVVPTPPRNFQQSTSTNDQTNKSYGRFPDGNDNDNNCGDFLSQSSTTLVAASTPGANNIKIAGVGDFSVGQKISIGSGSNSETAVIATVGTPGATTLSAAANAGATVISVGTITGFSAGQMITIGSGANLETVVIVSVTRRRFGNAGGNQTDSIAVTAPLKNAHAANEQVSGSGITFTTPLTRNHEVGTLVAGDVPTPGAPNQ